MASLYHELAPTRGGTFWSASAGSYDLFQSSADGRILRTLLRRPPWFSRPSPVNYDWKNRPPPPHFGAVLEDEDGLLWVFVRVAAGSWREAWPTVSPDVYEVPLRQIAMEKLFATMIEVIDPQAGRVLARQRIDGLVVGALPGPRVDALAMDRGLPESIVVDHGPEFISRALDIRACRHGVTLVFIRPEKPSENAYIESFHSLFRDECLSAHWLLDLADARFQIEAWRRDYNELRPHTSLAGLTPRTSKNNRTSQTPNLALSLALQLTPVRGEDHFRADVFVAPEDEPSRLQMARARR